MSKQIRLSLKDGKLVEEFIPFDLPTETDEQKLKRETEEKINDYLFYLSQTDHKTYSDYEPKDGEDLQAIFELRKQRRRFIRENSNA